MGIGNKGKAMRSLRGDFNHVRRAPCSVTFIFKVSATVVAMLFAGGCAGPKRLTAQEHIAVWLSESPRTIAVSVNPQVPEAVLVSRDHHAGERVAQGALGVAQGGLMTIAGGCQVGGPIGCVVGVVLAPVGMVVGGVARSTAVKSTDHTHPLGAAQRAPEMFTVSEVIQLPALLTAAVSQRPVRHHNLRAVQYDEEYQPLGIEEGTLRLKLHAIELFGDVGDDPQVALMLKVKAQVEISSITTAWAGYSYEGSHRRVSAWLADDARLFRDEIGVAVRSLAKDIGQDLNSPDWLTKRPAIVEFVSLSNRPDGRRRLGTIEAGNGFPRGELTLLDNVWFIVDFEAPTEKGERSYVAETVTDCATKVLSVRFSTTWHMKGGEGMQISRERHMPPFEVVNPGAALTSAIDLICTASP
jgi:hypothetical protein